MGESERYVLFCEPHQPQLGKVHEVGLIARNDMYGGALTCTALTAAGKCLVAGSGNCDCPMADRANDKPHTIDENIALGFVWEDFGEQGWVPKTVLSMDLIVVYPRSGDFECHYRSPKTGLFVSYNTNRIGG